MHSPTGIVAGLASLAIIAIAAEPAAADTVPILPPVVDLTIEVLPRSPTATADEVDAAATPTTTPATTTPTRTAAAASAEPIKTEPTSTREQTVRSHGGGKGSAARQETPPRSPSARPAPSPTTTVFRVIHEPPAAAGPVDRSAGRWFDLAALAMVTLTLLAAATISRRRSRGSAPDGQARTVGDEGTVTVLAHWRGKRPAGPAPLPRGDDGGFAERFLEARRCSRHISDT